MTTASEPLRTARLAMSEATTIAALDVAYGHAVDAETSAVSARLTQRVYVIRRAKILAANANAASNADRRGVIA